MTLHILERLAATNPDCEIWWDSSPLVYAAWKRRVLDNAPARETRRNGPISSPACSIPRRRAPKAG